ncbi:hypothetical protein F4779DRAFT_247298 [Xylariaceae sp. FL0662B]|nr:hypothetical protein F4779DRAFT_247298 [Xylariaceae sp. FL0662B]
MSATMTMTLQPAHMPTAATTMTTTACCPNCGLSLPSASDPHAALLQAQKQIDDLQAQVRLLNQKATAAVDRWADYEDELSRLRAASTTSVATNTTHSAQSPNSIPTSSPRSSFLPTGAASRISQLLAPRKSTPNLSSAASQQQRGSISASSSQPQPQPRPHTSSNRDSHQSTTTNNGGVATPGRGARHSSTENELMAALSREKALRAAAEGRLNDTSREVEELSASLFEQANEMVAAERRARARLEERVSVLEARDVEKRDRLERLEGAMARLERVRALLGEK